MSSTQWSESTNAFFDKYVNSKTTLKQFVEQYENSLTDKCEKESRIDHATFNSLIPCITDYDIKKQNQKAYTNAKFKEFQDELRQKLYCYPYLLSQVDSVSMYEVAEDMKVGEIRKDLKLEEIHSEFQCACQRFESTCACVNDHLKITSIPPKYILERWRKNVKRAYTFVRSHLQDLSAKSHGL